MGNSSHVTYSHTKWPVAFQKKRALLSEECARLIDNLNLFSAFPKQVCQNSIAIKFLLAMDYLVNFWVDKKFFVPSIIHSWSI